MVLMPCARVVSAHAFIMIGGPIATTSSMSGASRWRCLMPSVTKPLMPAEPSSVQMISSSQTGAELVLPEHQVLVAEAEHADDVRAAFLEAARLRKDRRHAEAAADADDLLGLADRARDAHRPDQRVQRRCRPGRSAASPWWSCRPPG